jgi:hypothetical protein
MTERAEARCMRISSTWQRRRYDLGGDNDEWHNESVNILAPAMTMGTMYVLDVAHPWGLCADRTNWQPGSPSADP